MFTNLSNYMFNKQSIDNENIEKINNFELIFNNELDEHTNDNNTNMIINNVID